MPKKAEPPTERYNILTDAPLKNAFTPSSSRIYLTSARAEADWVWNVIFLVLITSKGVVSKPAALPAIDPFIKFQ